jgi:hypothetical protein
MTAALATVEIAPLVATLQMRAAGDFDTSQ